MKLRSTLITFLFSAICSTMLFQACKHEPIDPVDLDLLAMAEETIGFTWYKNSSAWLPHSSGSGHNFNNLRTRYNDIAASQLDSTSGMILPNAVFPEGSLIVKELSDNNSVERYAILYKKSDSDNADARGWVWGYIDTDATIAARASDLGAECTGCHLQSDNIDYMLMNKFFP